jgi:hypothetical protein
MKRRIFVALMIGILAWQLLPGFSRNSSSRPAAGAPAAAPDPTLVRSQINAAAAYNTENRAQIEAALEQEKAQQRMAKAVAQTKDYRGMLQLRTEDAWSSFINEHRPAFHDLRREAARSTAGTVSCTICGARGVLDFCVVCGDTGKCPTCNGTGALRDGSICPTCEGNGKCFHCHGSGKMACPFCDDGLVYARQPLPPNVIPID